MTNVIGNGFNQLYAAYTGFVIGDYTGQTVPPAKLPSIDTNCWGALGRVLQPSTFFPDTPRRNSKTGML